MVPEDINMKAGSLVRASEYGAKGFLYPSEKSFRLLRSCTAKRMPGWQPFGGKVAVVIPSCCVRKADRYDGRSQMVVWYEVGGSLG